MQTTLRTASLAVPMLLALPAAAAEPLGEHPAIIARRVIAAQGYDYEAKFYPHPAWLYLAAEAPRSMMDHPAVIVARRSQQAARDRAARQDAAPAMLVSR